MRFECNAAPSYISNPKSSELCCVKCTCPCTSASPSTGLPVATSVNPRTVKPYPSRNSRFSRHLGNHLRYSRYGARARGSEESYIRFVRTWANSLKALSHCPILISHTELAKSEISRLHSKSPFYPPKSCEPLRDLTGERSKSIMKSTAKTLVPAGPACDQRGARSRQAAGGAQQDRHGSAQRCQRRKLFAVTSESWHLCHNCAVTVLRSNRMCAVY